MPGRDDHGLARVAPPRRSAARSRCRRTRSCRRPPAARGTPRCRGRAASRRTAGRARAPAPPAAPTSSCGSWYAGQLREARLVAPARRSGSVSNTWSLTACAPAAAAASTSSRATAGSPSWLLPISARTSTCSRVSASPILTGRACAGRRRSRRPRSRAARRSGSPPSWRPGCRPRRARRRPSESRMKRATRSRPKPLSRCSGSTAIRSMTRVVSAPHARRGSRRAPRPRSATSISSPRTPSR